MRYTHVKSAVSAAPIAVLVAGCADFELGTAEARASEVCITGVEIDIRGESAHEVDAQTTVEDPAAALPERLDAEAELVGVGVSAAGGVSDFGFLERAEIAVAAEGLQELVVADLGEDDAEALEGSAEWFFPAEEGIPLTDYLFAPELEFDLRFEGAMPEEDWRVDVDLCAAGAARYGL